jgi:hypothetical protein
VQQVLKDQQEQIPQLQVLLVQLELRVLLVRKVTLELVFRFLVPTTQLKNLKQLSQQEILEMGIL